MVQTIHQRLMPVFLIPVLTASLILVAGVAGYSSTRSQREQARKEKAEPAGVREIKALLARQVEAWNRRDLDSFMQGYWKSTDLTFFSNTTMTSGWVSTLERYRHSYQSPGKEMGFLEFLDLKIELLGPRAAFARGKYHLKMSGQEASGIFTLVLQKTGEGWRIIHDHTSS